MVSFLRNNIPRFYSLSWYVILRFDCFDMPTLFHKQLYHNFQFVYFKNLNRYKYHDILLSTNIFEKSKFNYPVHIRKIRFLIAYWHVSIFSWAMPRSIKQSYSDLKLQPNNKKHESYKHVTYNLVETYLKAHLIYFLYHMIWIRIFK